VENATCQNCGAEYIYSAGSSCPHCFNDELNESIPKFGKRQLVLSDKKVLEEIWVTQAWFYIKIKKELGLNLPKQGGLGILKGKEFPYFFMSPNGWYISFANEEPIYEGNWESFVKYEKDVELNQSSGKVRGPIFGPRVIRAIVNSQLTGAYAFAEEFSNSPKNNSAKMGGVVTLCAESGEEFRIELEPREFKFSVGEDLGTYFAADWFDHALFVLKRGVKAYCEAESSSKNLNFFYNNKILILPCIWRGGLGSQEEIDGLNKWPSGTNMCLSFLPKGLLVGGSALLDWSMVEKYEISGRGYFETGRSLTNIYGSDRTNNMMMQIQADNYNNLNLERHIETFLRLSSTEGEANFQLQTIRPSDLELALGPLRVLTNSKIATAALGKEKVTSTKFCPECGNSVRPLAKFCQACGEKLFP